MKNPIYIHYGSTAFNSRQGFPIRNRDYWVKPEGGLWASRKDASFGWKNWCEEEEYRDCNVSNSFEFTLRNDANIAVISTLSQLQTLPEMKHVRFTPISYCIDFEECVRHGVDAIELCWYGEEYKKIKGEDLHFTLYGWDCDSIVILNPNIVVPIN